MKKEKLSRKAHNLNDIPKYVRSKIETIPQSYKKPALVPTLIDVFWCRLIYGAGLDDYFDFKYYSLNHRGRKSFATVRDKLTMSEKVNDPTYRKHVWDKTEFPKYYGELMGREVMGLTDDTKDEDLIAFVERASEKGIRKIISKPFAADSGFGIFILPIDDPTLRSVKKMFEKFDEVLSKVLEDKPHLKGTRIDNHQLALEYVLENHPDLAKLHPESLNTMRIITLIRNGKPEILGCYPRIGVGDSIVDNINSGGLCTEVDLETGMVCAPGVDHAGHQYVKHPTTGVTIVGFQIPCWKEVKELVMKAAMITPQVRYVGWDVAVTPNGPALIEGNSASSMAIQQIPKNIGKRYMYEDILGK